MKIDLGDVVLDTNKLIENIDSKSENEIKFYLKELVKQNEELANAINILYSKLD